MVGQDFLTILISIALGLFLIRWAINWIILSRENGTSFSILKSWYTIGDFFRIIQHIAISEWKLWWFDLESHKQMKIISNTLSTLVYILLSISIILFIL